VHDVGWRPWRDLRDRNNVEFALVDLPEGLRAICACRDGDNVIMIDRRLDPAERLAALAHELVHLERGGGCFRPGLPPAMRPLVVREEHRVDAIVADRLVPRDELVTFIDLRAEVEPITAQVVAEEFGVPATVASVALERLGSTRASGW
jgi:Zn-dependent peptidase ImmA (M78 family)